MRHIQNWVSIIVHDLFLQFKFFFTTWTEPYFNTGTGGFLDKKVPQSSFVFVGNLLFNSITSVWQVFQLLHENVFKIQMTPRNVFSRTVKASLAFKVMVLSLTSSQGTPDTFSPTHVDPTLFTYFALKGHILEELAGGGHQMLLIGPLTNISFLFLFLLVTHVSRQMCGTHTHTHTLKDISWFLWLLGRPEWVSSKCQLTTRVLKNPELYNDGESLVNHVMLSSAQGLRATTLVGFLPSSLSSCHNNREGGESPKLTNDQVLNISSACVSQLTAQLQGLSGWKPNRSFLFFWYFYFSKTALSSWQITFKAKGELRLLSGLWWGAIIKLKFTPLLNHGE